VRNPLMSSASQQRKTKDQHQLTKQYLKRAIHAICVML
jgi:hypothetical protein